MCTRDLHSSKQKFKTPCNYYAVAFWDEDTTEYMPGLGRAEIECTEGHSSCCVKSACNIMITKSHLGLNEFSHFIRFDLEHCINVVVSCLFTHHKLADPDSFKDHQQLAD